MLLDLYATGIRRLPASKQIRRSDSNLYSLDQLVVLVVWTDPEPYDVAFVQYAEGAVADAHTHRVHWAALTHALEIQAWVTRIR